MRILFVLIVLSALIGCTAVELTDHFKIFKVKCSCNFYFAKVLLLNILLKSGFKVNFNFIYIIFLKFVGPLVCLRCGKILIREIEIKRTL